MQLPSQVFLTAIGTIRLIATQALLSATELFLHTHLQLASWAGVEAFQASVSAPAEENHDRLIG